MNRKQGRPKKKPTKVVSYRIPKKNVQPFQKEVKPIAIKYQKD